jgi:HEAT repeat protein
MRRSQFAVSMIIESAFYIVVAFLLIKAPSAIAGTCNELERSTPQEQVEYLKSDRSVPGCVELAIERLGALKDPAAIDALIRHLDFRGTETSAELAGIYTNSRDWPAVTALYAIGPRALPALEKVLQRSFVSDATYRNALQAFIAIVGDKPKEIVLFLERAYSAAQDNQVRDRLLSSYKSEVRFCEGMRRSECLAVVNPSLTALPDPVVHE